MKDSILYIHEINHGQDYLDTTGNWIARRVWIGLISTSASVNLSYLSQPLTFIEQRNQGIQGSGLQQGIRQSVPQVPPLKAEQHWSPRQPTPMDQVLPHWPHAACCHWWRREKSVKLYPAFPKAACWDLSYSSSSLTTSQLMGHAFWKPQEKILHWVCTYGGQERSVGSPPCTLFSGTALKHLVADNGLACSCLTYSLIEHIVKF